MLEEDNKVNLLITIHETCRSITSSTEATYSISPQAALPTRRARLRRCSGAGASPAPPTHKVRNQTRGRGRQRARMRGRARSLLLPTATPGNQESKINLRKSEGRRRRCDDDYEARRHNGRFIQRHRFERPPARRIHSVWFIRNTCKRND